MIKSAPFGFPRTYGFGDGRHSRGRYPIEYYFSQGMQKGMWGLMTGMNVIKLKDSVDLSGMGNIKWFADASGHVYAIDDVGKVWKEQTPGVGDFAAEHTVSGSTSSGQGLIGDQQGRILAFATTTISKYDGTWSDSWKTGLTNYEHPADTYEDMVIFGNKDAVGLIDNADNMNLVGLNLPIGMTVDCLKAGKTGILIGANLGNRGVLMLWNTQTDRSLAPWYWASGKIQSIERVDNGWIVVTQKQILLTTGYATRELFPILDDPMGYSNYVVAPQGTLVVNNKLFILNQSNGYTRLRSGLYIFDLSTTLNEFVPVSTQNVTTVIPNAIYAAKTTTQEIFLGYRDSFFSKNYIGSLVVSGGTIAQYYPEILADTPEEKVASAVILNLGLGTVLSSVQNLSFNIAVKLYNFKRPLWGVNVTNATDLVTTLRVDGTNASLTRPQIGDEVTILEGLNAGLSRHVTAIAFQGALNETWTLDSALPNVTETSVHLSIQPFVLVERKLITSAANLPEMFFNVKNSYKGKKFLAKVVIDSASTQLEIHRSEFFYDDLGLTT
ncbi:MAG TPA: hypothetical protein VLC46_26885 [Thermoanaerobaculia bacterium]|jgi:hypothetical protein|nr:hypothetical protein [Thermoanaerobaculia bacterium]